MKENGTIEILIADEHAMCREALRHLLEREPGFSIAGEASEGEGTLEKVALLKPDIVLLDLAIPRSAALEVLSRIHERYSKTRVLILAESLDAGRIVECLKLGARGFVLKESTPHVLFKSIRAVSSGEYWIGRAMVADLVNALRPNGGGGHDLQPAPFGLTRRELEVVSEVAEGCTNKNIAQKLSIAEQTVKHHLTSIFQKVGVSNRLELAVFAMHRGIHSNS